MRVPVVLLAIMAVAQAPTAHAQADPAAAPSWIEVVSPPPGALVIARRPPLAWRLTADIAPGSLVVMLDGTDVTPLAEVSERTSSLRPAAPLASGTHTVTFRATSMAGEPLAAQALFRSRQTVALDEATTATRVSVVHQDVVGDSEPAPPSPSTPRTMAAVGTRTRVKDGAWSLTLDGRLRTPERNLPTGSGDLALPSWSLTGALERQRLNVKATVGDVRIDETPLTVTGFARRGGLVTVASGGFDVRAFSLLAPQVFGVRGATGVGWDTADHVLGVSTGLRLMGERLWVRGLYLTGGEPGGAFGSYSASPGSAGDVRAALVGAQLFGGRLRAELELDAARFDPDTSDDYGRSPGRALAARLSGSAGAWSYEAGWDEVGRDYAVVGQPGLPRDRAGVTLRAGAALGVHAFSVSAARLHDDVEDDPLLPRVRSTQAGADYTFGRFPAFPMTVGWQAALVDTAHSPSDTPAAHSFGSTATASLGWVRTGTTLGLQLARSTQDDRSAQDADSASSSVGLTAALESRRLTLSPSLSLVRTEAAWAGTDTWAWTAGLDMQARLFGDRGSADLSGSCLISRGSERSQSASLSGGFGWRLAARFGQPRLALRGTWLRTPGPAAPSSARDLWRATFVLSANVPFLH